MFRAALFKLFPNFAKQVEQQSREWLIACPRCGHEVSVWEAGGIRFKASGTKRTLGKCSACRKIGFLTIYRAKPS
jgi:DNA-directed RNA polymerase subunit RPC12/RpoP